MKKFFDTNTSEENITEKAFSHSLMMSALSIFLCLIALCSATYAWFGDAKESDRNTLVSGSFGLDIAVALQNNDGTQTEIVPLANSGNTALHTYQLSPGKYRITMTLSDNATVKGHCVIEIGGVSRHTEAIIGDRTANREGYEINSPFTFILDLTKETEKTTVTFKSVWGVSASSDILGKDDTWATSSDSGDASDGDDSESLS